MYGFTVVWQSYAAGSGGGDALKLAFDTREQAEQWHAALSGAVERQALRKPRCVRVTLPDRVSAAERCCPPCCRWRSAANRQPGHRLCTPLLLFLSFFCLQPHRLQHV